MSDFSNKTRSELQSLESDLRSAVSYFKKNLEQSEADLKNVTEALKTFAVDTAAKVQQKAETVVETVKEEVKKTASKKSTKKVDAKVEEPAVEDTKAEEPVAENSDK